MKKIHLFIFTLLIIFLSCNGTETVKPVPLPPMKINCQINPTTYEDIKVRVKRFNSKIVICLRMPDRKNITFFIRVPANGEAQTTYKFTPNTENMVAYHKDTFELPHCSFYPTSKGGELTITELNEEFNIITGNFKVNITNQTDTVHIEGDFSRLFYETPNDDDREGIFFSFSRGENRSMTLLPRDRCIHYVYDKQIQISTSFAYASSMSQYGISFSDKIAEGTYEMKDFSLYMIWGRFYYYTNYAPSKLVIIKHDTIHKQIAGAFYGRVSGTKMDYAVFYGNY